MICAFVFYGMHTENNRKRIHQEIFWLCKIIVCITSVLAVVGLILAFFNVRGEYSNEFLGIEKYRLIIYENRFTGLYTNPNLLGFVSVVSILACHILSKENFLKHSFKPKQSKAFLITALVLNVISLFLSDSNGGLLLLGCYIVFNFLYKLFRWHEKISIKDLLVRTFKFIVVVLCVGAVLLSSRTVTQIVFSLTSNFVTNNIIEKDLYNSSPYNKTPEEESEPPTTFDHKNHNVDSGRLQLLEESAVFIAKHPLFGIGKANIVDFGEVYLEKGLHFSDFHNGYLTIIVSSGLVGFIMFVAFSLKICRHIVKSLFLERRDLSYTVFPLIFAFLCAYCVYAVIEKTLVYEQTFMVVMFWYMLGYASMFIKKYNHIDEKVDMSALFKGNTNTQTSVYDVPTSDELEE